MEFGVARALRFRGKGEAPLLYFKNLSIMRSRMAPTSMTRCGKVCRCGILYLEGAEGTESSSSSICGK